jgi:autoinducer 2-degrading protein
VALVMPLIVVHVSIRVLPDLLDAFVVATRANAAASLREPGVARFDLAQDIEDPTRFVLVEVYRDADAVAAHKQTPHYATWRDTVAAMMAEPRTSRKLTHLYPDDAAGEPAPFAGLEP